MAVAGNETYLPKDVSELASDLKSDYKLTDYESLMLAIELERNQILKAAFVIQESNNNRPSALESIAIQLGQTSY